MNQYESLCSIIKSKSTIEHKGITFIKGKSNEKFLSYKQLYEKSLKVLANLQNNNIKKGDELLFQLDNNEDFLCTFWACILGGIVAVPLPISYNDEHINNIKNVWNILNNPYMISSRETIELIKGISSINNDISFVNDIIGKIIYTEDFKDNIEPAKENKSKLSDIAFVQFSSGSTGIPKGVILTHENILTNSLDMKKKWNLQSEDSNLIWIPLTHDMGLIMSYITNSLTGMNQFIMDTKLFVKEPMLWMDKINEKKVTLTYAPNFGYRHFVKYYDDKKSASWDLSSLRLAISGGEIISREVCDNFTSILKKHGLRKACITAIYGLAEATVGASISRADEEYVFYSLDRNHLNVADKILEVKSDSKESIEFIDTGATCENTFARICDENDTILNEDEIGYVQLKGKSISPGYYNDEEKTKKMFTADGWLDTQDLGFIHNGRLVITGRAKHVICINGQNYYSQDIERIAESIEDENLSTKEMVAGGIFNKKTQKEEIVLFVLYDKNISAFINILEKIKKNINIKTGLNIDHIIPIKSIPKTTSQKVNRSKLVKMFEEGEFNSVLKKLELIDVKGMEFNSEEETEKNLINIFNKYIEGKDIRANDNFYRIGITSISLIQIISDINEIYPDKVTSTDLFTYSTISKLAAFIDGRVISENNKVINKSVENVKDIAIIGMSVKMPEAKDLDEFWENIKIGKDCITDFPEERRRDVEGILELNNVEYAKGAYLKDIDKFDYKFFKFTPREARLMNPNQRMFLETAFEAIEDAGYGGMKLSNSRTGVFVGYIGECNRYNYKDIMSEEDNPEEAVSVVGNLPAIIPSRISYMLNLNGPAINVDTACSSSLVAVHLACQSLKSNECEMAIAGGVKINLLPIIGKMKLGIESSDGKAKTFDESSDGTGFGEGVGAILLKPLETAIKDGDNIYGIIKGSAINQDGTSSGITAPNAVSQADVIKRAWENSNIDPSTITYIEAHGTGTKLGDPIEVEGIQRAFESYTNRKQFCAVGSIKTNIGHLYDTAGIAGLIKSVLAIKNKQIPPSIHFEKPNKYIKFEESPLYINDKLSKWETEGYPRRCGVSSFGLGGTNCHVILEEPPKVNKEIDEVSMDYNILTLSAESETALKEIVNRYINFTDNDFNISSLCYTANTGRGHYKFRLALIFKDKEELRASLKKIVNNEFKFNCIENIYHGCNKATENRLLDNKSVEAIKSFIDSKYKAKDILERIAMLYIQGANIKWESMYSGEEIQKISLPKYPFDKERCWIREGFGSNKILDKYKENYFYNVIYKEKELKNKEEKIGDGTTIIITSNSEKEKLILNKLKEHENDVIQVNLGEEYKKVDLNEYEVGKSEDSYEKLIADLKEKNITRIIHLSTLNNQNIGDLGGLRENQNSGVISLFLVYKALMHQNKDRNIDITTITEGVNTVAKDDLANKPWNATVVGLGKVIRRESTGCKCKCIEVDELTDIQSIVKEVFTESNDYYIAYRKGIRYVECLTELNISEVQDKVTSIKGTGVYIITGGAGGIGFEIAKYLTLKNKVNLALLNRSKLPEAEKWDEVISSSDNEKLVERILAIRKLREMGANVEYIDVNVADEIKLKEAIDKLRNKYGAINGVIHSAGLIGEDFTLNRSLGSFENILSPKVYGTYNIDKATFKDNMDFFILCSSVVTVTAVQGQGDYTAANSFMDSFASYRNKLGKRTITINWPAWKEVGVAKRNGFNVDTVFKAISNQDAINKFSVVLNKNVQRVVIGKLNIESKMAIRKEAYSVDISEEINEVLEKAQRYQKQLAKKNKIKKVETSIDNFNEYSKVEDVVRDICERVFGFEEMDLNDSLFDIGADSILLSELKEKLEKAFSIEVTISQMFSYPTISRMAQHIYEEKFSTTINKDFKDSKGKENNGDIAVIGISLKMPMSNNVDDFWNMLRKGTDAIIDFPERRKKDIDKYLKFKGMKTKDIKYIKAGFIDEIDKFDYKFFHISPKEASLSDPNQKLFTEVAYNAIEDAGYGGNCLAGSNTGVYVGFSDNFNEFYNRYVTEVEPESVALAMPGNVNSIIASRIAYFLDLKGPSMVFDTACSSSLVAIHHACNALRRNECSMAIAGGVKINFLPVEGRMKLGIESSDYRTKAFDDNSDGTGIGEGVAAIVLKPLNKAIEDGDNIYALIKGSAINQDGKSVGITAPNAASQTDVILKAWDDANVFPETIGYIEAHGTGTVLGDPIEIEALQEAFRKRTKKTDFCAVSSVKTNIGHLYEASGMASIVKAILSLKNGEIIPNINFKKPNHRINFKDSPVYICDRLKKWNTEDIPRRCGVSAFGLSGTNCHMILEQAPVLKEKEFSNKQNIFTLSAKNDEVLMKLVKAYNIFFSKNEGLNLDDICYTANVGRGHYNSRIAILVNSYDELKEKIEAILRSELKDLALEEGTYYGRYKIIRNKAQAMNKGDITEEEKRKLQVELGNILKQIDEGEKDKLRELCEIYIKGSDIDWSYIYGAGDYRRISLPVYPFERTRSWLDIDDSIKVINKKEENEIHPLLEKCILELDNETIFVTEFSPEKHFVLYDHIIMDNYTLPGVTYIEILKQVSCKYYGDISVEFRNILFFTPVVIKPREEYNREVYTIVKEESDHLNVTFISRNVDKEKSDVPKWIKHAEANVYKLETALPKKVYLEGISQGLGEEEKISNLNELTKGFIKYGPRWFNYRSIRRGKNEAIAKIVLPDEFKSDIDTYYVHPALLDMATAAVILAERKRYLPLLYTDFKLYKHIPSEFYSYIIKNDGEGNDDETVSYNVILCDKDGEVIASIKEFKLKKADKINSIGKNEFYHNIKWIQAEQKIEKKHEVINKNKKILLIGDECNLIENLDKSIKNKEIINVRYGDKFNKLNDNNFVINPVGEDFDRLFKNIGIDNIEKILNVSKEMTKVNIDNIEANINRGAYNLFNLIKSALNNKVTEGIEIITICKYANEVNGKEKVINPENAAVFGVAKVLENEYSTFTSRCIDVDNDTSCEKIIEEIDGNFNDTVVAYRSGIRYVEEFGELDIAKITNKKIEIRENGVYVITGGTGGIGLEVAKYLSSKNKVNIVLLSRSGLPKDKVKNERVCNEIKEIEDSGSKVECLPCDVSKYEDLNYVLNNIRNSFGKINGIVHSAGIAGNGFVINKDIDTFREVLKPKTCGIWLLDSLTENDDLDFFVTCSSIASILSPKGQCDYSAANSYLDSFAAYRKKKGKCILNIQWPAWKEVGMAVDYKANVDDILNAISTSQAIMCLDELLNKDIQTAVVGEVNYRILNSKDKLLVRLSDELEKIRSKNESFEIKRNDEISKNKVKLLGDKSAKYNEVEIELSKIWGEVLGLKEINIYESLSDMGGDSISATSLFEKLRKKYPGVLDISDIFSYSSIKEMSEYIMEKLDISEEEIAVESGELISDEAWESEDFATTNYENDIEECEEGIAIIGINGRFPKADNLNQYWDKLRNGIRCIDDFPEERKRDTDYLLRKNNITDAKYKKQGYLRDIDKFDAAFFNIPPVEAKLMDPEQRLFLESAWGAIEDAGLGGERLRNTKTAVFVGKAQLSQTRYKEFIDDFDSVAFTGGVSGIIASRISYLLNLHGPSLLIDTACSSSLVAIHTACESLKNHDCDIAIAGGVSVTLLPIEDESTKMLESPDYELRPFDNKSNGTVWAEGVGALVLKPLKRAKEDGDNIYAVIKATGCNNDGASNGITAPSAKAQEELLVDVWKRGNINPETISYIEAHGTGTSLGDPVEINGLKNAFSKFTNKKQFCCIGTDKGTIGHAIAASGVAGLFKVLLAMKHNEIPPTVGFEMPNSFINFEDSPVYVGDRLQDWKRGIYPRRAAINSFGLSGTNCHMVIEEFQKNEDVEREEEKLKVIAISAKNRDALKELVKKYLRYINEEEITCLDDICYTACTGRGHYNCRLALIIKDIDDFRDKLNLLNTNECESLDNPGVFYGEHKLVPNSKKTLSKGECTNAKKQELSQIAYKKVNEYLDCGKEDIDILNEISRLYINGADIDWSLMYSDKKFKRVSIPTYPFARNRYWATSNSAKKDFDLENNMYYSMKYISKEIDDDFVEVNSKKSLVFIKNTNELGHDLSKHLMKNNEDIIYVELGEKFEKIDNGRYTVGCSELYYNELFENIEIKDIDRIIHFGSISNKDQVTSIDKLKEIQNDGVYSLFYLVKAIENKGIDKDISLIIVSEGVYNVTGSEKIYPQNAPIVGMARAISKENQFINCRCIDIDEDTSIDNLLKEFRFEGDGFISVYRNGKRYIEEFDLKNVNGKNDRKIKILDDGVYVITGGSGGIGIEVAKYLTSKNKVNLCLINRSKMLEREKWDEYLASENNNKSMINKINAIRWLESNGAKVTCIAADISDEAEVKRIMDYLKNEFGRINGVIHCAGVTNQELIKNEERKQLDEVLAPKIYGTWLFDKYVDKENIDFFVMFSSVATMFNMPGQADYSAGNLFMDSIAQYRSGQGYNYKSINWVAWKETGMAVDQSFNNDTIFKSILTKKAIEAFDEVMNKDISQVLIGELNFGSKVINLLNKFTFEVSDTIMNKINSNKKRVKKVSNSIKNEKIIHPMVERLVGNFINQDVYLTEFSPSKHWILSEHRVVGTYAIAGMAYPEAARQIGKMYFNDSAIELKDFVYITPLMVPEYDEIKTTHFIVSKKNENELGLIVASLSEEEETLEGNGWKKHVEGSISKCDGPKVSVYDINKLKLRCNLGIKEIVFNEGRNKFFIFGDRWAKKIDLLLGNNEVLGELNIPKEFVSDFNDYDLHPAVLDLTVNAMGYLLEGDYLPLSFRSMRIFNKLPEKTYTYAKRKSSAENGETVMYDVVLMNSKGEVLLEVEDYYLKKVHNPSVLKPKKSTTKKRKTSKSKVEFKLLGREDGKYTSNEINVAQSWAEVLGLEEVDIYSNFYEIGGDSVIAVKLINNINQKVGTNLNVVTIFNYLSISEFAEFLDKSDFNNKNEEIDYLKIKNIEKQDYYDASQEQTSLFILDKLERESIGPNIGYNMPELILLEGDIDKKKFIEAINTVVRRHEALRTSFKVVGEKTVQVVHDDVSVKVEYYEENEEKVNDIVRKFIKPFNLEEAPLFRTAVVKIGQNKNVCMFDMHHIVADGWSVTILIKEILTILLNKELPELKVQYKDYSVWHNKLIETEQIEKQEEYWLKKFDGEIPILNIPIDFSRPQVKSYKGDRVVVEIDKTIIDKLNEIAKETDSTLYMVLFAAYNILLSKYSGQEDLIIGSPIAGRGNKDLDNVIGMFVNMLAMRNNVDGNLKFTDFLEGVKENSLEAYKNQDIPFSKIVSKVKFKRDLSRNPLFDYVFALHNFDMPKADKNVLSYSLYDFEYKISRFDMYLFVVLIEDTVRVNLEYSTDLFTRDTAEEVIKHYVEVLNQIIANKEILLNDIELTTNLAVANNDWIDSDGDFDF